MTDEQLQKKHFLISIIINHLMHMFYLRSFLDHIRVRRSHVKTSQACMSTEVSIHQYVWASVPRNGLFTKVLLKYTIHTILSLLIKCKFWTSEQQQGQNSFFTALPIRSGYIFTQMYGMSQQSLHEWVSTDQRKKGGEMGGKIAHLAPPGMQFPSSIHTFLRAI